MKSCLNNCDAVDRCRSDECQERCMFKCWLDDASKEIAAKDAEIQNWKGVAENERASGLITAQLLSESHARVAELEARKCSHGPYQIWGTSDCSECDDGRVTLYYLGPCVECQHKALACEKEES